MNHNNRKFVLRFVADLSVLKTQGMLHPLSIIEMPISTSTQPLLVVRQRLKISLVSPAEVEEKSHIIWYKDEGGKDHGMDLTVTLIGPDNSKGDPNNNTSIVTGNEIPFTISLVYSNNQEAINKPNMLTVIGDQHLYIHNGKCNRKLRVNDISKNHQRQLFKVKVIPDISKGAQFFDIAGDESDAIEVRSKRTKRQREMLNGGMSVSIGGFGSHGSSSRMHKSEREILTSKRVRSRPSEDDLGIVTLLTSFYPYILFCQSRTVRLKCVLSSS